MIVTIGWVPAKPVAGKLANGQGDDGRAGGDDVVRGYYFRLDERLLPPALI